MVAQLHMLGSKSTIYTIMAIHQDWGITYTFRNPATHRRIICHITRYQVIWATTDSTAAAGRSFRATIIVQLRRITSPTQAPLFQMQGAVEYWHHQLSYRPLNLD